MYAYAVLASTDNARESKNFCGGQSLWEGQVAGMRGCLSVDVVGLYYLVLLGFSVPGLIAGSSVGGFY